MDESTQYRVNLPFDGWTAFLVRPVESVLLDLILVENDVVLLYFLKRKRSHGLLHGSGTIRHLRKKCLFRE